MSPQICSAAWIGKPPPPRPRASRGVECSGRRAAASRPRLAAENDPVGVPRRATANAALAAAAPPEKRRCCGVELRPLRPRRPAATWRCHGAAPSGRRRHAAWIARILDRARGRAGASMARRYGRECQQSLTDSQWLSTQTWQLPVWCHRAVAPSPAHRRPSCNDSEVQRAPHTRWRRAETGDKASGGSTKPAAASARTRSRDSRERARSAMTSINRSSA